MGFLRAALASSLLLAGQANSLDTIVKKGTKFFTSSGDQFFIKGVAYQAEAGTGAGGASTSDSYTDPLVDESICNRDVPLLQKLGVNVIRTYAINPDGDHDACMKLLLNAGIYVISDLSEPSLSINRDSPAWNVELFERYKAVIDTLGQYENTIGFFAGNEVTNNASNTDASAFVKAAVRDTKAYIADKMSNDNGRWMGVGYAANDDSEIRNNMADYFNCGDEDSSIDFWGYNIYSWCGDSSYTESGYDVETEFFSTYSAPVFFAEYGCNNDGAAAREWTEVAALFGDDMSPVFSGGIAYMYFEEANDYGLVTVSGDSASTMKDFAPLKTQYAQASPSSTSSAAYTPTNSAAACPTIGDSWKAAEALPPTPDSDLCSCMYNSLTCAPSDDLAEKDFGDIFGYICGADEDACAGIKSDSESGVYGPYLMCNSKQQLGYVLDAYYQNQDSSSDACDFDGSAKVVSNPSVASSCSASLSSASSAVEVVATATSASTSTGSGSGSSSSGSSAATPGARMAPFLALGDIVVGLYVLVAMGAGAAMVAL
ncbi:family 72 glycoside hydrolase [Xylariaceae sp. FL0804]|nr:family 72 glycoside hydrolase [Xylariaceae sp. FL0804]